MALKIINLNSFCYQRIHIVTRIENVELGFILLKATLEWLTLNITF